MTVTLDDGVGGTLVDYPGFSYRPNTSIDKISLYYDLSTEVLDAEFAKYAKHFTVTISHGNDSVQLEIYGCRCPSDPAGVITDPFLSTTLDTVTFELPDWPMIAPEC